MLTDVEWMIGAKPVSSSRITTLATIATITKIENRLMTPKVWSSAYGALRYTLPRLPIWIWSPVVAPNASKKNIREPTQKTGLLR